MPPAGRSNAVLCQHGTIKGQYGDTGKYGRQYDAVKIYLPFSHALSRPILDKALVEKCIRRQLSHLDIGSGKMARPGKLLSGPGPKLEGWRPTRRSRKQDAVDGLIDMDESTFPKKHHRGCTSERQTVFLLEYKIGGHRHRTLNLLCVKNDSDI